MFYFEVLDHLRDGGTGARQRKKASAEGRLVSQVQAMVTTLRRDFRATLTVQAGDGFGFH